jgi:GTP1/Obg family GTP-binding protein
MIKLQCKFANMYVVLTKKDSLKSSNLKTKAISSNKKNAVNKSAFEIECEKGFTIEESRKRAHDKIDSLWKK